MAFSTYSFIKIKQTLPGGFCWTGFMQTVLIEGCSFACSTLHYCTTIAPNTEQRAAQSEAARPLLLPMGFAKAATSNQGLTFPLAPRVWEPYPRLFWAEAVCFFLCWSFFSLGASSRWDQTTPIAHVMPTVLQQTLFSPFSSCKHFLQGWWRGESFVLRDREPEIGTKLPFFGVFWSSWQGKGANLLLLPLEIARLPSWWGKAGVCAPLSSLWSEHLLRLTTNDAARKYSSVWHQDAAVPYGRTELCVIGLENSWFFSLTAKLKNQVEKKVWLGSLRNIIYLGKTTERIVPFSVKYFIPSQMKCFALVRKAKENKKKVRLTSTVSTSCSRTTALTMNGRDPTLPPAQSHHPTLHLRPSIKKVALTGCYL